MDWIKQNKFLAGFLIIGLLGTAALGFLAFTAKGSYDEATAAYTEKKDELNRLQTLQPFPDDENLKKMQELQKAHQAAIDELHKQLAATEIPLEPMTPARFQDLLRESVNRLNAKAAERGTKLQDRFYLGFDRYQAEPPKDEAAAPLGRMVKAMEVAVAALLEKNVTELTVARDPLPQEGGGDRAAAAPQDKRGTPRDKDKGSELVQKNGFELTFVCKESALRAFLNEIVGNKQQFYVPSSFTVMNEQPKGPPKLVGGAPPSPPPPPPVPIAPDPNAPPPLPDASAPAAVPTAPQEDVKFVVGDERIKAVIRIEVLDFADLAAK